MSDIRDELADFIEHIQTMWESAPAELPLADYTAAGILASPVIRRIQAEAWDLGHNHCFHVENPRNPERNPYRKRATNDWLHEGST